MTPRGIRNHNPGNIRHSSARWLGMATKQTDAAFVQFTAPKWGIRALYRTLCTYQRKHRLGTVAGMIGRWAPTNENDTGSYVASVAKAMDVEPDEPIDIVLGKPLAAKMVAAIIRHENGRQPYSDSQLLEGINA
jgi:hypothetical protein